jgi:hypothetical protein
VGGGENDTRGADPYAYYDPNSGLWMAARRAEPVPGLWQSDGSFYSFDPTAEQEGEDVDGAERYGEQLAGVGGASYRGHGNLNGNLPYGGN